MIVGIEVGGTFTDLVMVDPAGALTVHKLPSTPADPSIAAVDGLRELLETTANSAAALGELLHGSTIAANALIQRRGARTALITTKGFRDVPFIQRQDKSVVYDMFYQKPVPLIGRDMVFEIEERMTADGNVATVLDEEQVAKLVDRLRQEFEVESIAVCLLHAYANPAHEHAIGEIIASRHPTARVSLSSQVAPEHREYERASTTMIDAYIGPTVDQYLTRFGERIGEVGYDSTPLIMQSNGGVVPLESARRRVANMFVSGPAAAVTAAAEIARATGIDDLISIDIGGTSCDVCLISGGRAETTVKGTAEFSVDGLPLNVMMTDIVTIGAGGGSIAQVDAGGMLRVGPQSAGAEPGPAAYGRGGTDFTLTDAMLLLGLLDPETPLPGDITLDLKLAAAAATPLCEHFDLDAEELAARVYRIAIANMAQALRRVSVKRGHDPRRFALLPCGGAGPLIAAAVAEAVGMTRIIVPPHPGIFSALGLALADLRIDYVQAEGAVRLRDMTAADFDARLDGLRGRARAEFDALGYATERMVFEFAVDTRYVGQGYELRVPYSVETAKADGPAQLIEQFHTQHAQQYGHSFEDRAVEAISFRLTAVYPREKPESANGAGGDATARGEREIALPGARDQYVVYQREGLASGFSAEGPALFVEPTTSTPVPPGWTIEIRDGDIIMLTRNPS